MTDAAALEIEIETEWLSLITAPGLRTYSLTANNKLVWGFRADRSYRGFEVGTYRRTVTLKQFREDVFFVYDQQRMRRHG